MLLKTDFRATSHFPQRQHYYGRHEKNNKKKQCFHGQRLTALYYIPLVTRGSEEGKVPDTEILVELRLPRCPRQQIFFRVAYARARDFLR